MKRGQGLNEAMTVGICGFGIVGSGLAELTARKGLATIVLAKSDEHLARGFESIRRSVERSNERDPSSTVDVDEVLGRIRGTTDIADVSECDIIIEAITEDIDAKIGLFTELNEACDPGTVFSSTTSSLSINKMATGSGRPERFVGIHFFNPVTRMELVEITPADETDSTAVTVASELCGALGKIQVVVKDNAGFLVNRLLFPYLLDAVRLLEAGTASREEIDAAMMLGCNMPIGPLKLIDLIGVETTVQISRNLYAAYGDAKFDPPDLLISMMKQNAAE